MKKDTPSPENSLLPPGRLLRCASEVVGVMQTEAECRLVALRPIAAGELLFQIDGRTTNRPSRYSVQIEEDRHVETAGDGDHDDLPGRYFWRFMNHACDPTVLVRGRQIIARRHIEPGEAVTYDYNTTEWDMAEPFQCRCGSPGCWGKIRGFKYLTSGQRGHLSDAAPHLRRMAQRESAASIG